jgi:hypothetical protein
LPSCLLAAPSGAIDPRLEILVSQGAAVKIWLSYNSAAYLRQRHAIPQNLLQNVAVVEALATKLGE